MLAMRNLNLISVQSWTYLPILGEICPSATPKCKQIKGKQDSAFSRTIKKNYFPFIPKKCSTNTLTPILFCECEIFGCNYRITKHTIL